MQTGPCLPKVLSTSYGQLLARQSALPNCRRAPNYILCVAKTYGAMEYDRPSRRVALTWGPSCFACKIRSAPAKGLLMILSSHDTAFCSSSQLGSRPNVLVCYTEQISGRARNRIAQRNVVCRCEFRPTPPNRWIHCQVVSTAYFDCSDQPADPVVTTPSSQGQRRVVFKRQPLVRLRIAGYLGIASIYAAQLHPQDGPFGHQHSAGTFPNNARNGNVLHGRPTRTSSAPSY